MKRTSQAKASWEKSREGSFWWQKMSNGRPGAKTEIKVIKTRAKLSKGWIKMSEGLEGEKGILSELPDISCMLMKYRKHGLCQLKLVTLSFDRTLLLSHSVMSDSLWSHGPQHTRLSCPSPSPRPYSNSCPLSQSVVWCNHLILCHPLLLLPSIFPSIRVFTNDSALLIRCPNCSSFSFSISPSNEYSGLISFRIDWFDLPAVQGILKSLLQYHSSKGSKVQKCKTQLWLHITIS